MNSTELQLMVLRLPVEAREKVIKFATEMKGEFESKTYFGSMVGDSVIAECDWAGNLVKIQIREDLMNTENHELVQDLIPAAIEKAVRTIKTEHERLMHSITNFTNDLAEENCASCNKKDECHKEEKDISKLN